MKSTAEIIAQFDNYVIANYPRVPIAIVRGEGSYIWDADGKKYLDLFPGWGVSAIGHCHPRVVEAIRDQVGQLIHMDNTFYTVPQGQLAEMISTRSFGGKCFFCNSGAEAIEGAIKLARVASPKERFKIVSTERSFHGRTYAAMTATGQPKTHQGLHPLLAGFRYVPFNDVDAAADAIDDETAAFLVEPIQGEGGVRIPDPDYLASLRELCDQRSVLLVLDEVQTGLGRTGKWFGHQQFGVEPDIMTLAKAIGGGTSLGVLVARPEIAAAFVPGLHATTYGGNPLVCAAGIAAVEVIEQEGLLDNARDIGEHVRTRVEQDLSPKIGVIEEVRAMGLMIGIELSIPGAPVVAKCLEAGLRINCTQETVLRMLPAMNVTKEQIDEGLSIIADALTQAAAESAE